MRHKHPMFMIFCAAMNVVATVTAGPNVLFIRTDDQAFWAVGANGNPEIRTPNMDRIHREGAHFTEAFVTTPVCSPSRSALMTGLHSVRTGIPDWIWKDDFETGIRPEFVTLPEAFQAGDYATGLVGKWHLGLAPRFHPTRNGFDYFMGLPSGGTQPMRPELEIHGRMRTMPDVFLTDFLTEDALHYIRQNRHVPFFLMVDYRAPHSPYAPVPEADRAIYDNVELSIPEVAEEDRARVERTTREYYACVSAVDRNVGRLLDLLDELELAGDTIVVFTSDHGYMIGHHGLHHKGNATYIDAPRLKTKDPERRRPNMFDHSIRVPLAIRWPGGIRAGTRIDRLVVQTDLLPTLIELAGVPAPEFPDSQPVAGRSLAGLLRGEDAGEWRDRIYGDYDMRQGKAARMRMVRTREWKLVRHYEEEGGEDELYHLAEDPGETRNLYRDPPDPAVAASLEADLARWMREVGDPLAK